MQNKKKHVPLYKIKNDHSSITHQLNIHMGRKITQHQKHMNAHNFLNKTQSHKFISNHELTHTHTNINIRTRAHTRSHPCKEAH